MRNIPIRTGWDTDMLHASTQKLIHKLCELTASGDIAWTEGERACSRFETEGYIVEVEADPATVRIFDANSRELERADAALLASTPWPGGDGAYAQHVSEMATAAHRIARGAERAISRILSSLSAPPRTTTASQGPSPAAFEFEFAGQPVFSTVGGAESEAAMAAAVADMALRLSQSPLEAAPVESTLMEAPAPSAPAAEPAPIAPPLSSAGVRTLADGPIADLPPDPNAFGGTKGFSLSARSVPAPKQLAPDPPARVPFKITATGLVLSGVHAITVQTPRDHASLSPDARDVPATPHADSVNANPPALHAAPRPASADVYKPWV